MNAGTILTLAGWAGCVACAAVAVSGLVTMSRAGGGWREPASWYAPLLLSSACVALLTALGVLRPAFGAALAVAPIAVIALRDARLLRKLAGRDGWPRAGRRFLAGVAAHLRDAFWNAGQDLRDLLGALRREDAAGSAPQRVPVRATPGVPPWRRSVPDVPSVLADPALGAVPAPFEVAAGLAASGVMVPAAWAAVAAEMADHEPETDEEHVEHMDGEVAGILSAAEGAMSRAETLGDVTGLDPAYISALYELADAWADLAAFGAQVSKRYHDTYDDLREAADGKALPAKRNWFGDGTATPGRAA